MATTKNPHSVSNVNVAQGPRTGNNPAQGKRNEFKAEKEARAPLAKVIQNAYGARAPKDRVDSKLEPIRSDVNEGKRKK